MPRSGNGRLWSSRPTCRSNRRAQEPRLRHCEIWDRGLALAFLIRPKPREPEVTMARAARERLCPLQVDASRCVGDEIEPANIRQDVLVSMARRELAEAASLVVDAEFKTVTRIRLDEIIDEIFRKFGLMAFGRASRRLLA